MRLRHTALSRSPGLLSGNRRCCPQSARPGSGSFFSVSIFATKSPSWSRALSSTQQAGRLFVSLRLPPHSTERFCSSARRVECCISHSSRRAGVLIVFSSSTCRSISIVSFRQATPSSVRRPRPVVSDRLERAAVKTREVTLDRLAHVRRVPQTRDSAAVLQTLAGDRGFQSRESFCAWAIWPDVILAATLSRFLIASASSSVSHAGVRAMARLHSV